MGDYVIVGDSGKYKECLVLVCGSKESAEESLNKMLTDPDEYDKIRMKDHSNFKIKFVPSNECWWHGNLD